ncbi:MAG: efflux RND transporter permease subunit, partial [Sedimentisphaerales bacterium]|nr:efflux RND transporter permease subunit [Sedimentisphaerales bacterium]
MIRFFARHPTAANLLMATFLIVGALTTPRILRETQPDFVPTEVEIRIPYPGATALETEEVVCRRVEDAIDGVDFVNEVRSDAREGFASIIVEMSTNGNIQTLNACLTLIQERTMLSGKRLPSLLIVAMGNPQGKCELLP